MRRNGIGLTLRGVVGWLRSRGLWWLAPLVVLLLMLGGMLGLAAAVPSISPFVYLLF